VKNNKKPSSESIFVGGIDGRFEGKLGKIYNKYN
jgi:hypothetical protein